MTVVIPAPYLLEENPAVVVSAPPVCIQRNRLMMDWYKAPLGWEQDMALDVLRQHEKDCRRCMKRNYWIKTWVPPMPPEWFEG